MRRGKIYDWLPLWRNKWLQGSTRWELDPAERSVFIDFLCLAGADDGFIRANPVTPYPLEYLSGMLQAPLELILRTIEKCIAVGKLVRLKNGVLYISNWKDYQLCPRSKRKLMEDSTDNQESREEERKENLDLDDTERSAGSAAQIGRVLGPIGESALDEEIERLRREHAAFDAELESKRKK
jgi:hypothetical protein